jgi:hypothetical protein
MDDLTHHQQQHSDFSARRISLPILAWPHTVPQGAVPCLTSFAVVVSALYMEACVPLSDAEMVVDCEAHGCFRGLPRSYFLRCLAWCIGYCHRPLTMLQSQSSLDS